MMKMSKIIMLFTSEEYW